MTDKIMNVMFAGVGGQGIILASDMLAEAVFRAGYDVKKSEIHGMSQRGGSVSGDVRFGKKVASPMIPLGEADILLALMEDQVEVCRQYLNEKTVVLTPALLKDYDPGKSLNVAMLGALNTHLNLPPEIWHKLIRETFKEKVAELNIEAFSKGSELAHMK